MTKWYKSNLKEIMKAVRFRFWLETSLALISGILLLVTLVWKDWIEIIFKVEPDSGNGEFEWLIVVVLLAVTIALFGLARSEWRRVQTIMQ